MSIICFTNFEIHKYSIQFFQSFFYFIILMYTFSFEQYKEYIIRGIWFGNFSVVLLVLACAIAIANLWNICLKVNILKPKAKSEGPPMPSIVGNGNILFSKPLSILSLPSRSEYRLLGVTIFGYFLNGRRYFFTWNIFRFINFTWW